MLEAVQEWGQSEERRIAAVQTVLDAAGFQATATCGPVFGGIWPKPCTGLDGDAATAWLLHVTATMQRGDFNAEVRHVEAAIAARTAAAA